MPLDVEYMLNYEYEYVQIWRCWIYSCVQLRSPRIDSMSKILNASEEAGNAAKNISMKEAELANGPLTNMKLLFKGEISIKKDRVA